MTGDGKTGWTPGPLDCLARAERRDAEKGGAGLRTTAEVAEWCGLRTPAARRLLWALADSGEVESFGHVGATIEWRITDAGRAALSLALPKMEG